MSDLRCEVAETTADEFMSYLDSLPDRKESSLDLVYTENNVSIMRLFSSRKLRGQYLIDLGFAAQNEQTDRFLLLTAVYADSVLQGFSRFEIEVKKRLLIELMKRWGIDLRKKGEWE